jgi:Acyl-protein synthetase, LuxE
MTFEDLLSLPAYSLDQAAKQEILLQQLAELTEHHRRRCPAYARLVEIVYPSYGRPRSLADIPSLPVTLFKTHRLASVPDEDVAVVLTSSGTTGQSVSRIYLDRATAQRQTQALAHTMSHILGPKRLPMIVADTKAVLQNRDEFSARGAGIMGMMNFGRDHFFALDENMRLDEGGVRTFVSRNGESPFLIFGFTFMVWRYFAQAVAGLALDLSSGILIHSGGWKKMQEEAIGNAEFKARLAEVTGLKRVYNFYGLVEQVGGVFLEGDDGYLYATNFSDVIVRDPVTWQECPPGVPGVIQVLSALPLSYPGHSILTEDLGVIHGVDDSTCGRGGKYFSIIGRVPKAELRGCSDTHAYRSGAQ